MTKFSAIETRLSSPLSPCFPGGGFCPICGKGVPPGSSALCGKSLCAERAEELGLPHLDQDRCPRCLVKLETRGTLTSPPMSFVLDRFFPFIPPEAKERLSTNEGGITVLDMKCPSCSWLCLLVSLDLGIEVESSR